MLGVGWISIDSAIDKQSLFLCLLHVFLLFFFVTDCSFLLHGIEADFPSGRSADDE